MLSERERVVSTLLQAGCVDPSGEADVLFDLARREQIEIDVLLARRLAGEPLAWIVGSTVFCGVTVTTAPGVFVPRPHSEALAMRAAELLPASGIALDLCTGTGAVALVMARAKPEATIVAIDLDPMAVACARGNGVDALLGDLDDPVPPELEGQVDVLTSVVPYVPSTELQFLPRDVQAYEPRLALDGGIDGTDVLRRVVQLAGRWLRPGGAILLELGGDESAQIGTLLEASGFKEITLHADDEGQDRFVEARWGSAGAHG